MTRKKLESKSVFDMPSEAHLSFFGNSEDEHSDDTAVLTLAIGQIDLADEQPRDRQFIADQEIDELSLSIQRHGVLQPIVVRQKEGERYELIAGERRYRASLKAGLGEIPVVIKDVSDGEAYEIALIENLQRKDLNPLEKTAGILKLCAQLRNLSVKEMSGEFYKLIGIGMTEYNNVVSLPEWSDICSVFKYLGKEIKSFAVHDLPMLGWPQEVQNAIRSGDIQPGHGRIITKLKNPEERNMLLKQAIEEGLSVRALDGQVKRMTDKQISPSERKKSVRSASHPLVDRLNRFCKIYNAPRKWSLIPEEKQQEVDRLQSEIDQRLNTLEGLLK